MPINTKNSLAKPGRMSSNSYPVALNVVVNKREKYSIIRLLLFVNEILECNLNTMEDLVTGAVYCQVLHRMYPKSIPINKVKWYTSSTYDFQTNYKLLQTAFNKLKVTKYIPSEELVKGRGHLEFCNWIIKFYLTNNEGLDYNPKTARKGSEIGLDRPKATGNRRTQKSISSANDASPIVKKVSPVRKPIKASLEELLVKTIKMLEEAKKTIKEKDKIIGVLKKHLVNVERRKRLTEGNSATGFGV